jgi:peptidoglycan-associated lipoprotein
MKKLFCSLAVLAALAGCSSQEVQKPADVIEAKPTQPPPAVVTTKPPPPPVVTPVQPPAVTGDPLNPLDPRSMLNKQRSVFFDYDSTVIKDEFKPMVTAHSRFLTANRAQKITIEGNTDERGSREYNIALGQRRADSVKQMMMLLGVQEGQIESVSLGEEKPRNPGHDEAAFSENRRSDIRYAGDK